MSRKVPAGSPRRRASPLRRHWTLVALVLAGLMAFTGYRLATGLQVDLPASDPAVAAQARQPPDGSLARFYDQRLVWSRCGVATACTDLWVPADYAEPDGPTVSLRVTRVPAGGDRLGVLVVNPGGPGVSAAGYVASARVGDRVRASFDLVGLDARGTGGSAPLECVADEAMDAMYAAFPAPRTGRQWSLAAEAARAFGSACRGRSSVRPLASMSSQVYAKDLDVLRAALEQPRLNYLGYSYGTFVAQRYLAEFPSRAGQFVLDGVVPDGLDQAGFADGQASGFELATRSWAQSCVASRSCPLDGDAGQVASGLAEMVQAADKNPATVTGDARVPALGTGWAYQGVLGALYDPGQYETLTAAVREWRSGDGTAMMRLASATVGRDMATGSYTSNVGQVINAIACIDRPGPTTTGQVEALADRLERRYPVWGRFMAATTLVCAEWPVPPGSGDVTGREPVKPATRPLVVGTTRDPATPYPWVAEVATRLGARLVRLDGDGHTAYRRSDCVDRAVEEYLVTGAAPATPVSCEPG